MSNNNIKMSVKGRYGISVLDKNKKVKKEKSVNNVFNVVTYEGAYYSLIGSGLFESHYAAVGTGTTELSRSSPNLTSEVSGRTAYQDASRGGNEVDNLDGTSTVTLSRTFPFSLGSKVGTFSEVGLYTLASNGTFIAGQLIKDEFGNPTTVTVLSDEQLVITYILEWTLPNTSQLIGSGTLTDASSNTYDYEMYAQPYFNDYTVGSSSEKFRYDEGGTTTEIGFYAADGSTSLFDSGSRGSGFDNLLVHDGSGTVTVTTRNEVFSPSDGNYTGLTYLSFYSPSSSNSVWSGVSDTATNTAFSSDLSRFPLLIKFVDPITKTSDQSFSITASYTITL